jgi:hypothetical protein
MVKKSEPRKLETVQDVEEEIESRVRGEEGLLGAGSVDAGRREEIRAQVEALYEAGQLNTETRGEIDKWKAVRDETTPYYGSFHEAVEAFGGEEKLAEDAIDDYVKLENKSELIGVPSIVVKFWFSRGEILNEETGELEETEYVTMQGITEKHRKFTLTDGSTGVYRQVKAWYERKGKNGGLPMRNGLRVSEYPNPRNPKLVARTYYLT